MEKKEIIFKIETGANVNKLHHTMAKILGVSIEPSILTLKNYDGAPIEVLGKTKMPCKIDQIEKIAEFQIVKCNSPYITGLPMINQFGLLKRVQAIGNDIMKHMLDKHEDLFSGVGELKDYTYKIKLKDNCQPIAEYPRKIPIRIEGEVKKELQRVEQMNIIRKLK